VQLTTVVLPLAEGAFVKLDVEDLVGGLLGHLKEGSPEDGEGVVASGMAAPAKQVILDAHCRFAIKNTDRTRGETGAMVGLFMEQQNYYRCQFYCYCILYTSRHNGPPF